MMQRRGLVMLSSASECDRRSLGPSRTGTLCQAHDARNHVAALAYERSLGIIASARPTRPGRRGRRPRAAGCPSARGLAIAAVHGRRRAAAGRGPPTARRALRRSSGRTAPRCSRTTADSHSAENGQALNRVVHHHAGRFHHGVRASILPVTTASRSGRTPTRRSAGSRGHCQRGAEAQVRAAAAVDEVVNGAGRPEAAARRSTRDRACRRPS